MNSTEKALTNSVHLKITGHASKDDGFPRGYVCIEEAREFDFVLRNKISKTTRALIKRLICVSPTPIMHRLRSPVTAFKGAITAYNSSHSI